MEKTVKLNDTPVRTSRNFLINNIEIDNLQIPENIRIFENVTITTESGILQENVGKINLKYGIGKVLEDNANKNANSKIKIVTSKKEKINISYEFDDDDLNLVNIIEIDARNSLDLTIEYKSVTCQKCFHNGVIKLNARENAKVNVTIVNLMNNVSDNFEAIENLIEENASVNYTIVDMGGKRSLQNYYSNIVGDNAQNDLKTIYLADNDELKDINYIIELQGKETNADIDVQGAISGTSKKNFKGTIDFKKGCIKAKGNENEYCMILSDTAKSIALPMLLCTEEDVEGSHSTASRESGR